jgi:O-antigen/teichoic acid export membrane protein
MENDNNIKSGKSSFFGDVLKLVTGTTFAQMLVILASPIIARLFTPEDLGLQAPFISIGSILGVIVCLRYELAIMLPESDDEAANILVLSLVVAVLISLVSVPVFWIAGPLITQWLHAPELNPYLRLIPPVLIFGGIGMGHPALNYWASRTRRYKELSITRVIGQFVTVGYQLSTGILGFATAGNLILSNVFGAVISPCVLAWQIWNEDKKLFLRSLNCRVMFEELKKHKKFPIYSTWSSLLNSASWQLPSLLLSAFFSSTIVGYYSLGFRILQVPMSLIGSAIGQVFFQRAAESSVKGTLAHLVEEVFSRLVVLGLFPMFMLTIIGKDLFTFLFGTNWAEAGVYAQILSVWAFFWFVSAPMNTLFSI